MLTTSNIRNKYEQIQKQLFYMIPEKWDRVYLYASVVDHFNGLQTGEMFFYYFPKSILKKNPVNVYEIPNKFNIDESAYLKLAEKLYEEIKKLRKELVAIGEKPWTSITISIQNFKFNVKYEYENLQDSKYTSYDRHLIWRYQYLDIPLSSYSKKERKMIEEYLQSKKHNNNNSVTYQEGIYKKPVSNITEYDRPEETKENIIKKDESFEKIENKKELGEDNHTFIPQKSIEEPIIKSQILNINH